jgi:hypothetical protein
VSSFEPAGLRPRTIVLGQALHARLNSCAHSHCLRSSKGRHIGRPCAPTLSTSQSLPSRHLTNAPTQALNPHSPRSAARSPPALARFPPFKVFGRRPPCVWRRLNGPASENLHKKGDIPILMSGTFSLTFTGAKRSIMSCLLCSVARCGGRRGLSRSTRVPMTWCMAPHHRNAF